MNSITFSQLHTLSENVLSTHSHLGLQPETCPLTPWRLLKSVYFSGHQLPYFGGKNTDLKDKEFNELKNPSQC